MNIERSRKITRWLLYLVIATQIVAGFASGFDGGDWLEAWTHWLVALMATGWWMESRSHDATRRWLKESRSSERRMLEMLTSQRGLS